MTAFHSAATNTFASMIAQLGQRYEGPIAFSDDPDNLNQIGLIEAYETVFRRAQQLSIDSNPPVNYEPANAALLNIGSRIADFYLLLGNEAYAPTPKTRPSASPPTRCNSVLAAWRRPFSTSRTRAPRCSKKS